MKTQFDVAIIGAGPGGFDAAIRARELGFKTALIDKAEAGGTCLNSGCIPTKSLLASTKLISKINRAENYGLKGIGRGDACVAPTTWDFAYLVERKNKVVETLKKSMVDSVKRSGIEWISGTASLKGKNKLIIDCRGAASAPIERRGNPAPTLEIESSSIIIATGSEPVPFPGVPFDGKRVLSSTQILELKTIPQSLLILGGGIVGVEFASIFQALGVKVTIVEMLDRLIATEDEDISRRLESIFARKVIQILTGQKATLDSGKNFDADCVLDGIGRKPCVQNLGLEKIGIKMEKNGVQVNEYLETSVPGIFAIGDVTSRSTGLAHGASAEGIRVIENLKGPKKKMDYRAIPSCIYTDPEIASVGARSPRPSQGGDTPPLQNEIVECKIPFSAIGKSHVEGETEGFIKMKASRKDGKIIEVSGIGGHMTEIIHEAMVAIHLGVKAMDLAQMVHAHPTESEILAKAAQKLVNIINVILRPRSGQRI